MSKPTPEQVQQWAEDWVSNCEGSEAMSQTRYIAQQAYAAGAASHDARQMRDMLQSMQSGEMTVSRGIELLEMWLAGNYTHDQLPPAQNVLPEDRMPWDEIDSLRTQLAEAQESADKRVAVAIGQREKMKDELAEAQAENEAVRKANLYGVRINEELRTQLAESAGRTALRAQAKDREWLMTNAFWRMYGHGKNDNPVSAQCEVQALGMYLKGENITAWKTSVVTPTVQEPVKQWPFVETPGEFTNRLLVEYAEFGDMLAAVRGVLIERPAVLRSAAPAVQEPVNQMLLEALRIAREDIDHWAGYASDYFRNKHNLAADLADIDAAIAAAEGVKHD